MKALFFFLFFLFQIQTAFSAESFFSKDIGNKVLGDQIGEDVILKRKITFGIDGTSTDVSSANPFPITCVSGCGGGGGGSTVDQGSAGTDPWLVTGSFSVSNFPATQPVTGTFFQAVQPVSQSGNWTVLQGTSPWVVSGTIAATQSGVWTVQQGTPPWSVSQSGTWNLNNISGTVSLPTGASVSSKQPALGVAGTASADVITVQGIASMTPLLVNGSGFTQPVSGSVSVSNFPSTQNVNVTNASIPVTGTFFQTTQPVSGTVIANQGTSPWVTSATQSGAWSVTANAGTNLNTSALALDTSVNGILRSQGSTTTGQSGPLIQGAVTTAAPTYTTGQTSPLSLTPAGALRVDNSGVTQPVSGTVAVSNFPATQAVTQSTSPWVVSGTVTANAGSGTFTVGQATGTNLHTVVDSGSIAATQSGAWTTGRTWSLLNTTDSVNSVQSGAWTTGRTWALTSGTDSIAAVQSGTWTVQQGGTPTAVANAWPMKVTDGTNTAAVKAASTAAIATDPSAVVALSPNSPLPIGSNNVGSINNVTGTVSLPTGASTSALQTTGNTTLSTISTQQTSGTQKSQVVDGSGNVITVKASSAQAALTDTAIVVTGRPDNVGTPTQTSVSCAATSTTVIAASTATMFLSIRNPTTATNTVWINLTGAAAVAAAPSIDLPPGAEADFFAEGASFLPTAQINCISGGAASTVVVIYK